MRFKRSFAMGVAVTFVCGVPSSAATVSRRRTYPDLNRVYKRLMLVYEHRGLACAQSAFVGSDVATRYEHGLPTVDYPPPPTGVPGGRGRRLDVATNAGQFTGRMTARGSDFVAATCENGAAYVRFESLNHYYLVRSKPRAQPTPRIPAYGGVPRYAGFQSKPFWIIYSGDGAALLAGRGSTSSRLHWTSWNAAEGDAWGADWHNNCVPDCARGTFFAFRATVKVYRPRRPGGYLLFTRMRVTYTGKRPPGYAHQTLVFRLSYSPQYGTYYLNAS